MALSKIDPAGLDIGQIGGRRNLIINGAMQVAQRGTSFTGITSGTGTYTLDRYDVYFGSLGTWTIEQSTDAPSGFSNSLKCTATTADASPAAGDYAGIVQYIEAQNLQNLAFGTADAQPLTISFWVKSNKTGSGTFEIRQVDNSNKQVTPSYTINSADTWEYKTISIPADTAGVINNDNGAGFQLEWWLNSGSTYTGGTSQTTWATANNADRNAANLGVGSATNDYFAITGVQLEVGSVATPFEHRSYGEELALCQRYYQLLTKSGGGGSRWFAGQGASTTQFIGSATLACPMRATPDANDPSSWNVLDHDTYSAYTSGDVGAGVPAVTYQSGAMSVELSFTGMNSGTLSDNRPAFIYMYSTLELDAEL